jgi:hypothetical protein
MVTAHIITRDWRLAIRTDRLAIRVLTCHRRQCEPLPIITRLQLRAITFTSRIAISGSVLAAGKPEQADMVAEMTA